MLKEQNVISVFCNYILKDVEGHVLEMRVLFSLLEKVFCFSCTAKPFRENVRRFAPKTKETLNEAFL